MDKSKSKAELTKDGIELFGSEEQFKQWLTIPNMALGDKKPGDLMRSKSGREKIQNALDALNYGTML